jgi:prolipoprotein diacylglyceryltransferase
MLPLFIDVLGWRLAVWDVMFFVAVIMGYVVLRIAIRQPGFEQVRDAVSKPRLFAGYLLTVYVTSLGAQIFSYAFDSGTSLLPPPGLSPWNYYLNPVAGPKTLYGCVLALPVAVMLLRAPPIELPLTVGRGLDLWTPPLLAVLAVVRLGCFLQGCCYGVRSEVFGLRFAEGSIVYHSQVAADLIARGEPMLPVVPAQLFEAAFLFILLFWSLRAVRKGVASVFVPAIVSYSVFRFAIEFVRADPARNSFGPLSTSQWVALVVIGVVAGLDDRRTHVKTGRRDPRHGEVRDREALLRAPHEFRREAPARRP